MQHIYSILHLSMICSVIRGLSVYQQSKRASVHFFFFVKTFKTVCFSFLFSSQNESVAGFLRCTGESPLHRRGCTRYMLDV